ncbi:putative helicase [Trypanosoma cruzi]|nr:putative helicase [Trypanosoma cruzi]
MRRVRLLIEQQLRSRQAEAELLQWESTMNGIALRRQKGGERGMETPAADVAAKTALLTIERARDEGGEQTGADGDTVVAAITGETSVVPPVGIRGLRGVVSRTAPWTAVQTRTPSGGID